MKKKLLVVVLLGILFLLPVALYALKNATGDTRSKASNPNIPPQNITITNLNAEGFTVNWLTTNPTVGKIYYAKKTDFDRIKIPNLMAVESFDTDQSPPKGFLPNTHSVTLTGLSPLTEYAVFICNSNSCNNNQLYGMGIATATGSAVRQGIGIPMKVKTLTPINPPEESKPIFGTLKFTNKKIPTSILIFATLKKGASVSAPLSVSILPTAVQTEIPFSIELANAKLADLTGNFPIEETDLITVKAFWVEDAKVKTKQFVYPVSQSFPIKDILAL